MLAVFVRQVAASASPVQIARARLVGSSRKNFIKPTKAIPKQSGESKEKAYFLSFYHDVPAAEIWKALYG